MRRIFNDTEPTGFVNNWRYVRQFYKEVQEDVHLNDNEKQKIKNQSSKIARIIKNLGEKNNGQKNKKTKPLA